MPTPETSAPDKLPDTEQLRTWRGEFGREYTDRNTLTPAQVDELYQRSYGIARTEINRRFLDSIPRSARILEVGCNVGNQLLMLEKMGFTNLYGIEIQEYALQHAQQRLPSAVLKQASALAIPYPDSFFDMVFTSGVLIHIAPADLITALREIRRCAKSWIFGFEYYAPQMTDVNYRGHQSLLWKADYAVLYAEQFPELQVVREDRLPYLETENIDSAFLLHAKQ